MNWKSAPNLFANGKFKAKSELSSMPVGEVECAIHGYSNGKYRLQFSGMFEWVDVSDCTLIARPISDMANVEVITALEHQDIEHEGRDFKFYNTWLEGCVNEWKDYDDDWDKERLSAGCQNYLLSIGVYPFSQDHFDTGEILNTNSIKE